MKKKVVFLVLITAVCVSVLHAAGDWSKYTSPEGRYSILFPGEPRVMTQESPSSDGENVVQHIAGTSSPDAACVVAYFDIKPGMTFSFDKGRDGMVAAVKGTLLEERDISLGNSPGRELKIAAQPAAGQNMLIVARYYQVGARVYVVQFIALKSSENTVAETSGRYFDSFQVTPVR
ncbi:MAG TPA: hypothetical protein VKE93_16190 [Candidatus Angelobacter sp.]|nr:hypothetical protein [Candidatus Angelobacter sp.]